MLHILHSCYSFCHIGGGFTISSRQQESGKGLTFPFFSGLAASGVSRQTPLFSRLTKCQTKGSIVPFLAPKYELVDSEALLRRFAKYTLLRMDDECCPCGRTGVLHFSQRIPDTRYSILSETFRFIDTAHLLESETPDLLLPFSKDLTSGRETIVFGR